MQDELQYMYALERFGVKPGLDVMKNIMAVLGHPEMAWPSVHIAGTNGKGSTASFMATMLCKAGYKVGLYTSPHLLKFNERIQINGQEISDAELALLVQEIRIKLKVNHIQATFFEFTTALAFLYFARQHIEIAVIEVGMGGRLDATNVITPLVSVITNIGLDHTSELGGSLEQIATEKAGIIKEGVPVIAGEKNTGILYLLEQKAQQQFADWHSVTRELRVMPGLATLKKQVFTTSGVIKNQWEIGLLGAHQIDNAVTALLALHYLNRHGLAVSVSAMTKGLKETVWAGRMEVLSQKPLVIIDGAHNEDGAKALYQFLQQFKRHNVLVLACKRGKDDAFMLKHIVPLFQYVVVTEGTYDPLPADDLLVKVKVHQPQAKVISSAQEAVIDGLAHLPTDGFMVVTGSLYMIGSARQALVSNFLPT